MLKISLSCTEARWKPSKGQCYCVAYSPVTSKPSCISDPHSHQSQEEVLALNAAAIIANIKLQRQLSKKKTASGDSEDCTASPEANAGMITHFFSWYMRGGYTAHSISPGRNIHLLLNQNRYSKIPLLLQTAPTVYGFIPLNYTWQVQSADEQMCFTVRHAKASKGKSK